MVKQKIFSMEYRVPYADTDKMGVVYYANYLVYFERFRNEFLRELGLPYKELESQGIALPVSESYCKYKKPALYDDLLEIKGWVEEVKGVRVKIVCEVRRGTVLLAKGYTVHACLNSNGKLVKPPQQFFDIAANSE